MLLRRITQKFQMSWLFNIYISLRQTSISMTKSVEAMLVMDIDHSVKHSSLSWNWHQRETESTVISWWNDRWKSRIPSLDPNSRRGHRIKWWDTRWLQTLDQQSSVILVRLYPSSQREQLPSSSVGIQSNFPESFEWREVCSSIQWTRSKQGLLSRSWHIPIRFPQDQQSLEQQ